MGRKRARSLRSDGGCVISIGMQKGGCAKTTNACHLAAALGERGQRVLLWDVDENYGASRVFKVPADLYTTVHVLTGEIAIAEAILRFDEEDGAGRLPGNVDFLASSRELRNLDRALSRNDPLYNPNECLFADIEALRALREYDYVLLDTGPQGTATTRSAYMVSDYYVLSVIPETLAVDSIADAIDDISNARRPGRNPDLHLLGLIVSCMDRRVGISKQLEAALARDLRTAQHEALKFETTVSRAAAVIRAAHSGRTVLQTEPRHRVSEQYRSLAGELEDRVRAHRSRVQ